MGVDYSSAPDIRALNDQIKAMISVNYDKYADNIIISSTTENPDFTKIMISELLIATDENFKNQERSSLDNMIIYLNGELSVAQAISQRDAISQILKSQLLKQALVNSDSLYKVKVVREVETSRYPTTPNIFFTLILFSIVGFFISLARHTIIFIRSHTNILSFLSERFNLRDFNQCFLMRRSINRPFKLSYLFHERICQFHILFINYFYSLFKKILADLNLLFG